MKSKMYSRIHSMHTIWTCWILSYLSYLSYLSVILGLTRSYEQSKCHIQLELTILIDFFLLLFTRYQINNLIFNICSVCPVFTWDQCQTHKPKYGMQFSKTGSWIKSTTTTKCQCSNLKCSHITLTWIFITSSTTGNLIIWICISHEYVFDIHVKH